jgi:hypothetical protein
MKERVMDGMELYRIKLGICCCIDRESQKSVVSVRMNSSEEMNKSQCKWTIGLLGQLPNGSN